MNKKINVKIFLFCVTIFFGLFFLFSKPTLAACSWKSELTITFPELGTSQTTGGCTSLEAAPNNALGEKCSESQPAGGNGGGAGVTRYVCCCGKEKAAAVESKPPKFTIPDLQVKIPGMAKFTKENCNPRTTGGYSCEVPWMGEYIIGLYNYGLSIAGILAAIMLMAGGVLWLISAGDASKITQAKELITGSVTGLIILASSYVLLIQINPNLIKFKSISVDIIEPVNLVLDGSDSDSNNSSNTCTPENQLTSVKGLGANVIASDPRLKSDAAEGLKKAIKIASEQKPPVKLLVSSATRSYTLQKQLWDAELSKQKGDEAMTRRYVSNPASGCQGSSCSGHCASVAVDLCIEGTKSCQLMSSGHADESDPDMKKLQNIMMQAGWKRYCGEWWHFQYGLAPKLSCSP